MTKATVTTKIHETLDAQRDVTTKVAFNLVGPVNDIPYLGNLALSKLLCASIDIDPGFFKDLLGRRATDAKDIGERDDDAFVLGKVDSCYTCQSRSSCGKLTLSLRMLGYVTDDTHDTLALDDLTLVTDSLD
jgi:hypothetical protein